MQLSVLIIVNRIFFGFFLSLHMQLLLHSYMCSFERTCNLQFVFLYTKCIIFILRGTFVGIMIAARLLLTFGIFTVVLFNNNNNNNEIIKYLSMEGAIYYCFINPKKLMMFFNGKRSLFMPQNYVVHYKVSAWENQILR